MMEVEINENSCNGELDIIKKIPEKLDIRKLEILDQNLLGDGWVSTRYGYILVNRNKTPIFNSIVPKYQTTGSRDIWKYQDGEEWIARNGVI